MTKPVSILLGLLVSVWFAWSGSAWAATTTLPVDASAPVVEETIPPAGATVDELVWVEVVFDEAVDGVTAGSLLVNDVPATSVTRSSPDHYLFSFPAPAPGVVRFGWAPGHGLVDQATPPNAFKGGAWTVTLDPTSSRRNLRISEFMADNDRTLYDDDCDRPDWIEIHNTGATPVNLAGWALTDDRSDLGKWRFPEYSLDADGYLVVFASQKNKTNLPARVATACRTRANAMAGFHTNFKLDPDGEYLGLVAPNGEVISEYKPMYPTQRRDVSYGAVPGGVANLGYFVVPTPRKANSSTGDGFAPRVTFSRPGGTFLHSFALTLSCADPKATIRYTVDGTFPGETNVNLLTYTGVVRVTNTMQVRARALVPGLIPGAPASATYLSLTNEPTQLGSMTSTLPIVLMTTLRNATFRDSVNTPVHFSLFEPRNGRATLLDPPTLQTRGGAKTRGSSTGGQPQSNFAIEWWDEFDQDRDLGVLGMPEDSEWVLYAPNEYDAALIHNPFTMELSRQMNFSAPLTRFVEVYLNRGGQVKSNDWFGLYVLMQKPGLAKGRIDAPKAQPEDVEFPEITGSYMFKTDREDPGDTGFNAGGGRNMYVEPKEREMKSPQRAPQLAYLTKFFKDLDAALLPSNPALRDPVLGYRGYIEVTNWVDFHMLETLSGQVDAIRLSTYFYKRRGGKLEYGPRWDYDRAWESKGDSRDDSPRVWDTGGGLFGSPWWPRVLGDRDAWQLWIDRWQMYRRTVFSQTNMFALMDRMTNEIAVAQPRENRRWAATAPRLNYRNEILIMKNWISNRLAWIDLQMAQPPRLSSPGGSVSSGFQVTLLPPVSISNPTNVTIFYTLDGTDPRPPVGTNPPTAMVYSGPITITANTRVTARVRDAGRVQRPGPPVSTPWSSAVVGVFAVTPPALLVTELMYHPAPPPAGSAYTDNDFEFVELKNISGEPLDLAGYTFTQGITFRFDAAGAVTRLLPGERVLVVANREALLTRYPGAHRIAGEFTGNLADEGERLALVGPVGEPVFDFEYGRSALGKPSEIHRPRETRGLGFSLVLEDESITPEQLGDVRWWSTGSVAGGSPGLSEAVRPAVLPVYVNEVLALPPAGTEEWIELHNPGTAVVDVGGWWLTDDLAEPKRARLPAGTKIPAGGFLRVGASVFGAGSSGFGLNREGDAIWLLSADVAGQFTGWVHGFEFGASSPNVSFGRYLEPGGTEEWAVPLTTPTPGAINAGPVVGPVVIGEMQVARSLPALRDSVRDEFIELRNITDRAVPLFDSAQPSRTWHVRGDVEIHLPPGITLPPDGLLVIVGFDPTTDVRAGEAFRHRHAVPDDVVVVGPWSGKFAGDAPPFVRLLRPGQPAAADGSGGTFVLVEEFRPPTEESAPWPKDAGTPGFSLVRVWPPAPGSSLQRWRTASPTPGSRDADLDGLPDEWEIAHGLSTGSGQGNAGPLGDPDGDGFRNLDELHNGTDPRTSGGPLALRFFGESDGRMVFLLDGVPGRQYSLEQRPPFGIGEWQVLRTLTAPAAGPLTFVTEMPSSVARFYRLSLTR